MSQPPSQQLPVPTLRAQNTSAVEDADDGQRKPYGKRYPRVWTKDAHGGKYSISTGPGARGGYDALEEHPDGTALVIEPGYEKPPTGATTNFVGNHMTQGAIDLAQDALTAPDRDSEQRLARLERARGAMTREGPVLVRALPSVNDGEISPSVRTRKTAIERYVWVDEADRVVLTVRARDLGGAARMRDAAMDFAPSDANAFSLEIPSRPVGEEHEEREEQEEQEEEGSTRRERNSAAFQLHVLSLRLHAPVDAAMCTLTHDRAVDAVRVTLNKRTPAPWPALTETHPMPALEAAAKREAPPPPDLVALRREIIERREGRLAERLPWRRSNAPLALGDEKAAETEKYGASGDGDAAASNDRSRDGASEVVPEDVASALAGGSLASERGAYAEAVERFTRGLRTDPNDARLLVARARARRSLGCVRECIDDLSAAIEALRGGDDARRGDACPAEIVDALVARGECHAERERYDAASADFGEALRACPGLASASEGICRARRLQRDAEEVAARERERAAAAAARGEVGGTAFAKPGMALFEDRGKAGKPF